jgi:two-component system, OmpR family, response regulator MprA
MGQHVAMGARLLVVDDDRAIREALARALHLDGYTVATAPDGAQALTAISGERPDLLILDVMMPSVDGLTVCRVLRAEGDRLPILVLTARTETADKVAGLDAGADDYLPKPFDLDELLARVRALLRRTQADGNGSAHGNGHQGEQILTVADLKMDPLARRAWRGDVEVALSRTEYELLELLVRNAGIVLDHSTIYDRIWGYDFGPDSKNLAVYIRYLRRKIDEDHELKLIHTVRGVGYTVRAS